MPSILIDDENKSASLRAKLSMRSSGLSKGRFGRARDELFLLFSILLELVEDMLRIASCKLEVLVVFGGISNVFENWLLLWLLSRNR